MCVHSLLHLMMYLDADYVV